MRKQFYILAAQMLLLVLSARAVDCFVLLDNIPGESIDPWHPDWIEARLAGTDVNRPPAAFQLNFSKALDKSSPLLALKAADGRLINRAAIEFVADIGRRLRFYRITLTNASVRSFAQISAATTQNKPDETVALDFESISWTYTEINPAGMPVRNVGAFWDLVQNRGGSGAEPLIRLTGSKEGADMVVSWSGRGGTTYKVLGSPEVTGPYQFLRNVTTSSNATLQTTFPVSSGNLFFLVETAPVSP
jgi:type VI secretion system Hcp family effector